VSLELPAPLRIAITQAAAMPRAAEACDHVAVLLPESAKRGAWPAFPHSKLLESRYRARNGKHGGDRLLTELEDGKGSRVAVAFVANGAATFDLLTLARKLIAEARATTPRKLGLIVAGLDDSKSGGVASRAAEASASALLAAEAPLPEYKSKPAARAAVESLSVHGAGTAFDIARCRATAEANSLARWLTTLPPNLLHPASYRALLATLARRNRWTLKFHDEKALAKRGAEAFLAVVRGSAERDAGIVELTYTPKKKAGSRKAKGKPGALALVGKGLCYDTGGSNLKAAKSMYGMHGDMGGSAVALATLAALSALEAPFPVRCYLAIAQNRIGPKSYIPNEVLRASNGVTIETVHTDAEGRMVLADTLVLASEGKPAAIMDFATLTGAAVYALTDRMGAVFSNRSALNATLIDAGIASGERVWPFPMHADYDEALESKVADVKQCLLDGQGDHILAARFLSKFVGDGIPWVHFDMCPSDREGGLAHIPSFFTGFGVRFALELVLDRGFGRTEQRT
jgi:leucyl aminopeptidase